MNLPPITPRKIHIIGGPGSGKTTLAHQLADRLGAPCVELDRVGYEGGAGAERPLAVRLAEVAGLAAGPAWVSEGIFLGWTGALFSAADCILWLDLPWRVAAWRIVLRHVKAELRGNNPHTGWRKLYRFLGWCRGYYDPAAPLQPVDPGVDIAENRVTTEFYLRQFQIKVLRCRRPAEVAALRQRICP